MNKSHFAQFRHCNYNGGGLAVQRKRDIFGKNAFSGIRFYWPQDEESTLYNMNFRKNGVFVKHPNGHQAITKNGHLQSTIGNCDQTHVLSMIFLKKGVYDDCYYEQPPSYLSN